ncbi:PAS domain S-box protein [Pseudomonas anguilliseptica]|uniref:histidine kinase n=1 Tax=Pseudomonas anguilliseptica TaxID=53406 RepID=A0A1H4Y2D7_PSEAG|nr:PAS domain S-box protein [Pseudomonas anguilliseptica]SED12059.1 PAS domain S-box-containing protein [Pseudomonas anguilliseptica]
MLKPFKPNTIHWIVGLGSLGLALFFSVLGGFALNERETLWNLQIAKQHELQSLTLRNSQQELQQQAQLLAETIAADSWLVELVRQAYALQSNDPTDTHSLSAIRSQLYTRIAPRWRNLQGIRPFALYVHLAPTAEVLLRVHKPQWFADFPAAQRPMLLDSLNYGVATAGLATSGDNLSMRAIVPLQVESPAGLLSVGALEVSLDVLSNLQQLDRELDAGVALLIKRQLRAPGSSGETLRAPVTKRNQWHLAGYSQVQVQRWQTQHRLPDPEAGNTFKLLDVQGRTYLLNQVYLNGYQADPANIGSPLLALTWRDITALYNLHQRDKRWLVIKWLLAWLAAEMLLLLLLQATRHSSQLVMRRHHAELQNKHQQSEESRQLLALITQTQAAYINADNQREAFDTLLGRILEVSASQFGFVGEIRHDEAGTPFLRTFAISNIAWDAQSRAFYAAHAPQGLEFRNLDTLFGQVIRSGQMLISNDPINHPHSAGLPPGHPPLLAFAGLPIHANGELRGMLGLANRTGGYDEQFAAQLQPLLTTLGQLLEALRRDTQRTQTQQRMQRQQAALRALNEIAALPKLSTHEQLRQALQLGAEFYGMPIGIISQIDADTYQVRVQVSPPDTLQDGQCFTLGDTYCSITLRSNDVLAIAAMGQSEHAAHPCYPLFALESYIGTSIWVAGKRFGTLCFASSEVRSTAFDDADEEFIRLFARWVGATLERMRHEEQTREARRFLQAVLDSATGVAIITSDCDGLITLFNSGAERLLGYRSAEVIGRHSPALFHLAEEIQERGQQLSHQFGTEVSGFTVFTRLPDLGEPETRQWTYRRKNGEQRIVNLTVSAMRNAEGVITGYLGIASDINDLQQTTRALQKSESRFRGLVSSLPGAVYRCRNDADWSMSYLSEEIQAFSGYPASDFINNRVRSFSSVVHPDDLPITYRAVAAIERQESFELTYRLLHADGHSVWVREKGRGEYDNHGELQWISGFIWDISDRKAVEDQLRLSQQRFSNAFSLAPQGMALVSLQGQWLEVNDQLCEMLGYSREQLLCSDFQQITHPDDLEADLQHIEELLAGEISTYQMEKRYLDSQRRIIWVLMSVSLVRDSDDKPVHFVVQIQDFNERIASEMAIREREDYLRALLDNVLDAIITIDQQGYIETFNHAAERIFGYSHLEVSGHRGTLLLPEPQRSMRARYLSHFLKTGIQQMLGKEIELTAMRSNGETFTIELAISQISHQGERRFIAVIRDIEERKRIERMKNEFVSTVSHELRTPLTAISGSLGLINGGVLGEVPEAIQQMLQIAQDNSQRLNLLINDLLDMEKLVAGKMLFELHDEALQPLLEQAIEENQPYASHYQVQLQLQGPPTQARVRVDKLRLAQVLANLLSNAAKFSPQGQTVEVRVEQHDALVRVSVTDHGPGVPENFQARIFSKFSQADATDTRQKGGTGLGLAISKEIIERIGGKIGFHSSPGHGATFWFELATLALETTPESPASPEENRHA